MGFKLGNNKLGWSHGSISASSIIGELGIQSTTSLSGVTTVNPQGVFEFLTLRSNNFWKFTVDNTGAWSVIGEPIGAQSFDNSFDDSFE